MTNNGGRGNGVLMESRRGIIPASHPWPIGDPVRGSPAPHGGIRHGNGMRHGTPRVPFSADPFSGDDDFNLEAVSSSEVTRHSSISWELEEKSTLKGEFEASCLL